MSDLEPSSTHAKAGEVAGPASPEARWGKAPTGTDEIRFLQGPHSRASEAMTLARITMEFIHGFRTLHFVGPCATVFGSARFKDNHPYYELARQVGGHLARAGFTVMTGGGPGIMEAANRGAKDVGGRSVGCNIELPSEQQPNPYLDTVVSFRHFYIRKVMLVKYSYGFVVMPGGFGTLDELFETATLVQTGKILNFPMVLMGVSFWKPMMDFLKSTLVAERTIDPLDVDRLLITDDPAEATAKIVEAATGRFGLTYGQSTAILQQKGWFSRRWKMPTGGT